MIRSTYRNLMVAMLVLCFGVALYLFGKSQSFQVEISDRENDITRLQQELENAQSLNVALTELDNLTITEQTATQLDILRHLGLEQSEIGFELQSRDMEKIGETTLYTHKVRITGNMPYEQGLALCDRLQNTKKIVLTSIEIRSSGSSESSNVNFAISGKIYGLDKTITTTPTEAVAPVIDASSTLAPIITSGTSVVSGSALISGTVSATVTTSTSTVSISPITTKVSNTLPVTASMSSVISTTTFGVSK